MQSMVWQVRWGGSGSFNAGPVRVFSFTRKKYVVGSSESRQSRKHIRKSQPCAGRLLLAPLRFCTLYDGFRNGYNFASTVANLSEACAMSRFVTGDLIATSGYWIRSWLNFSIVLSRLSGCFVCIDCSLHRRLNVGKILYPFRFIQTREQCFCCDTSVLGKEERLVGLPKGCPTRNAMY